MAVTNLGVGIVYLIHFIVVTIVLSFTTLELVKRFLNSYIDKERVLYSWVLMIILTTCVSVLSYVAVIVQITDIITFVKGV